MRREQKAVILIVVQIGHTPFLWGVPGQGKSSFIRSGFLKLGYRVKVLRVNTVLPHHLNGIPVPDLEGNFVRYLPPEWAHWLNEAEQSVLFLDDVSCASPTGQTAALGLLDEREIGGLKLKAIPIAAANPDSLATARFSLDAAAANRCVHLNITSDAEGFRSDVLAGFPAPEVPKVRKNWEQNIPAKAKLITDFLCTPEGQKVLSKQPESINEDTISWPSERTWEMVWRCLAACDSIDPNSVTGIDLPEVKTLLFRGCVGRGAHETFMNYFVKPLEVDVTTALRQGRLFSFPEEGDRVHGLLWAVTNKVRTTLNETTWKQSWSLLEGIWETKQRDRGVTFALDLLSLGSGRLTPPPFYEQSVRPHLEAA